MRTFPTVCVLLTQITSYVLQDVKGPTVVVSVALVHVKHLESGDDGTSRFENIAVAKLHHYSLKSVSIIRNTGFNFLSYYNMYL